MHASDMEKRDSENKRERRRQARESAVRRLWLYKNTGMKNIIAAPGSLSFILQNFHIKQFENDMATIRCPYEKKECKLLHASDMEKRDSENK